MGLIMTPREAALVTARVINNQPSSRQYRVKNHVAMTPDKGFTKQLKKLNPDYDVVWDWGSEKWEIWCFPKGREGYHVTTVQTAGRTYQELGTEVLLRLKESIWWGENFSAKQLADYLDELDNQVRRRKAKDFSAKIEAIVFDTFDYSRAVPKIQVPRSLAIERVVRV